MKNIILLLCITFFVGCSTVPVVSDATDVPSVGPNCNAPYKFTKDCSRWARCPTGKIKVNGQVVKICATDDGKTLWIQGAGQDSAAFLESLIPLADLVDPAATKSNRIYQIVKETLSMHGVNIVKTTPVKSFGTMYGYMIELNAEGYELLCTHYHL